MKAIFRGSTVVLVPESDNEAEQLGREFATGILKMQVQASNTGVPCYEVHIAEKVQGEK